MPCLLLALTVSPVYPAEFDFWYGSRGNTGKVITELCDEFNRRYQEHRVSCTNLGSYEATLQKTIAAYRAGKQPALVQLLDIAMLDMLVSDATVPIKQLPAHNSQSVTRNDYFSAVTDFYGAPDGSLYAFPFNVSTIVLYSNRQQLATAGITHPPDTWEEFADALQKLRAAGIDCPWTFQLHPWFLLEQFSALHRQPIAGRRNGYDGLDARYQIANASNRRMMEDIQSWYNRGLAILDSNLSLGNTIRAFGVGECAMLIESTAAFGTIARLAENRFPIAISLLPHYANTRRGNTLVGGASLWVMRGFDNATYQAVGDFLSFLGRPENQVSFAAKTGFLPVTQAAWAHFKANTDPQSPVHQLLATGLHSINQLDNAGIPGLRLGFYLQFRQLWIKEMQRALAGHQSVATALEKTQDSGNLLLRRFQRVYQQ